MDRAPLSVPITAETYQEGFKISHLETYDSSSDPNEHLHTYQAIMKIQNATDAMMCKVFPVTLKSTAKRWYHKLPRHSINSFSQLATLFSNKFASQREIKCTATKLVQVHQKEGKSLRNYMQCFNKATLDIDNVLDTICLSALLHGLKPGRFLDDLLEDPPKSWSEVNDRSPIPVEGVVILPIYVGIEPRFRMTLVSLAVKMELAFNAIIGRATLYEEIQKLLQVGFIKKVEYSEWVSNMVLVKKPNGKWRICINFTNLNDACPKDPHPLPNVEKLVERVVGHERMSFLDASSRYHQVQLWLDDQEKMTFYVGDVIYYYVMMPFGLKNARATYQKLVQLVFKLQIDRNIEIYVDDIIVKSLKAKNHIDNLNETFQNLTPAQMKLNAFKCMFAIELGKFLGCVVSKKGIEINSKRVQAIKQMEPPKTVKYVQHLTGHLAALHRPELSGRLIGWDVELSEYDVKFEPYTIIKGQTLADFLVECHSTTTEEAIALNPIWALYADEATNSEGSRAGVVLIGPNGFKSKHILRFKFRATNNVAKYEALIYSLKLAIELRVQDIRVFSDSQLVVNQVKGYCDIEDPQLAQYCSMILSDCQVLTTDPLSSSWTTPLVNYPQSGELPKDPAEAMLVRCMAAHFTLIDGQLYKRVALMPLLHCLTPYESEYVVREIHEGACGTHIGGKMLARKLLRQGYYWPNMVEDIKNYVKKCPTWQFHSNEIHMLALWSCLTMPSFATGETPFSLSFGTEAVILVLRGAPS
ncbi:hypothetical protein SLEP1_g42410 [Rubroshorea leprosula]|uniref:Uncharacterized protein n=1 Tax=Rubroshorea leprosula TaxID=152421 RepID=A0AAV5L9Q6_9ROSI|nr:hypothetical protein SLEP1_g42410 [Rubroshorea leprosula]